eukprot:948079_1
MGFHLNYILRAFKIYEKSFGYKYNVEVMTEIIVRLQGKDKAKRQSRENASLNMNIRVLHSNTNNVQPSITDHVSIPTESTEKPLRNGLIQWKISGNIMQQFKNAVSSVEFHLPSFKTIDGTIWRLQFYPHSTASHEYCSIQCRMLVLTF